MKRHIIPLLAFIAVLFIAGFAFTACSGQKRPDPETKMFREFSIDDMVKRVNAPELKNFSGSTSYSSSTGIYSRRDFSFIYSIEEAAGAKFDEASFISKLKAEAEKEADETGAHRTGSGSGGDTFHFDYTDGDHEGWVEVAGTRIEGNRYKLWCVIRENTKR